MDDVVDAHGSLDCAVNCAGLRGLSARVVGYPIDAWRRAMAVNREGDLVGRAEAEAGRRVGRGCVT